MLRNTAGNESCLNLMFQIEPFDRSTLRDVLPPKTQPEYLELTHH